MVYPTELHFQCRVDPTRFIPFQDLIVRNKNAPVMVMAIVNPPSTARLTSGLICETPVRPYRIPSTP
jgi:hypothetical protein